LLWLTQATVNYIEYTCIFGFRLITSKAPTGIMVPT
jgi:hypothetical protein